MRLLLSGFVVVLLVTAASEAEAQLYPTDPAVREAQRESVELLLEVLESEEAVRRFPHANGGS